MPMVDVSTRLLRSFLSVAAEGGFSRAAARLGCSQGTMSLRIRQLEEQLGVTLFLREHHDVRLTGAGVDLLPHAQAVVDRHDALVDAARHGKVSGSVRLGFAEDYAVPLLPHLLRRMSQSHPGIELAVTSALSAQLDREVQARRLDLAVVTLPAASPRATLLSQPQLVWVGASEGQAPHEQPVPLAVYPEGCAFRSAALAALKEAGVAHRLALVSGSGQVIQGAVAAGTAITIMAEGTVPAGLSRLGTASHLPPLPHTFIQIIEREGGLSAAGRQVRDTLMRIA